MQDDSVFADFDVDQDGRLFLLRISFDGYGCCETATSISPMTPDNSERMITLIHSDELSSGELAGILSEYFVDNCDVIWEDALETHNLI